MNNTYNTKEKVNKRAHEIVGKTLKDLSKDGIVKNTKSSFGDAFENWFGKEKDSLSQPDMDEAGVELKATPIKKNKNGRYSAAERLVLNIINYEDIIREDFNSSKFLFKNKSIQLGFYEKEPELPKSDWSFKETALFELEKNEKDLEIIKQDWELVHKFVKEGRAHELSERYFQYLSPCTKGKNNKSMRTQPNSEEPAKQRAFSFKTGYITSILRKYIFGDEQSESIIHESDVSKNKSIEDVVIEKFKPYIGQTVSELSEKFGIKPGSKGQNYQIAASILNLKGNAKDSDAFDKVDEFEKAMIKVKTIQFNEKNINKESMSFPAFKFKELAKEQWEDEDGTPSASWNNFLRETRFLFIVFKKEGDSNIFKGVKFFSIPESDIDGPIKEMWKDTVKKLNEGVKLTAREDKGTKDGYAIKNNFIAKSDKMICHIRPHASLRDYTVNGKYADQLPSPAQWTNKPTNGNYSDSWMTKQCFWINNDYIAKQLKELL
ncbi:Sau3AI family type II restriction endonuclease [Staphylococcus condimenti]|uniref:Sau3AI family type II restriction endonuclease n=1 Tax=Staphylococcus condimenti TaxID=70255 RepID=UPI00254EEBD7|nr:Sau3AI family type II restriction endonuclease [Staphylococcus condimenti]MDK8646093.1 Sau3AI family type II restriction endonuclease [Staphylococcus condimenti]